MSSDIEFKEEPSGSRQERYKFSEWIPHGSHEVPDEIKKECDRLIDVAEGIISGTINIREGVDVDNIRITINRPGNTEYTGLKESAECLRVLAEEVYRIYTLTGATFKVSIKGKINSTPPIRENDVEEGAQEELSIARSVLDQLKLYYNISK